MVAEKECMCWILLYHEILETSWILQYLEFWNLTAGKYKLSYSEGEFVQTREAAEKECHVLNSMAPWNVETT